MQVQCLTSIIKDVYGECPRALIDGDCSRRDRESNGLMEFYGEGWGVYMRGWPATLEDVLSF